MKLTMLLVTAMHADHPSFKAPPNPDGKIWQYMDLAQFVSMLQRKQLFFVKANQLRDPYEGTMPQHNNNNTNNPKPPSAYEEERRGFPAPASRQSNRHPTKTMPEDLKRQFQIYREKVLINGWHCNEYESAAMWQLYSQENAGIAIQSTASRLGKCFGKNTQDTVWIGKVDYLDYSKELEDEWNLFKAFVIKRKSFEYENEIRAITCLPADGQLGDRSAFSNSGKEEGETSPAGQLPPATNSKDLTDKGKYVSADLQTLIENVYIAPFSEPWFKEVVESLLSKYELKANVIKSDLYIVY